MGRVDLLLPTGGPAKAASAANPPPEALPDAPFQIHSFGRKTLRGSAFADPLVFSGRVDLLLPTGGPAKAASAANPPPEALPDAPFQIHSFGR